MTTRTPEQIEAGARALCRVMFYSVDFDTMPASTQTELRRWSEACLTDAADAAAAPAVGVDRRTLERLLARERDMEDGADLAPDRQFHKARVLLLLELLETAQPEPGTHDDAGQATEGGEG